MQSTNEVLTLHIPYHSIFSTPRLAYLLMLLCVLPLAATAQPNTVGLNDYKDGAYDENSLPSDLYLLQLRIDSPGNE